MKKENRILKSSDFSSGVKNFRKIPSKNFIVFYNTSQITKLGIIISKKVNKKAVIRNKIKRQIKNIFYQNFFVKKRKDLEIIILVRKEINSLSYKEIESKLIKTLKIIYGDDQCQQ